MLRSLVGSEMCIRDSSPLYVDWAVDAIEHLEEVVGHIPFKHAIGPTGCDVIQRLKVISESDRPTKTSSSSLTSAADRRKNPGPISRVIVFDRTVDLLTPLLTQHSYAGLVDDLFTGDFGAARSVCVAESGLGCGGAEGSMFHPSADPVWKKCYDLGLTAAMNTMKDMKAQIGGEHEQPQETETYAAWKAAQISRALNQSPRSIVSAMKPQSREAQVQEVRHLLEAHGRLTSFVKSQLSAKLSRSRVSRLVEEIYGDSPNLFAMMLCEQALYNPTVFPNYNLDTAPELVLGFLLTAIEACDPLVRVMRLICVASQSSSGLQQGPADRLRQALDEGYGHEAVMTFESMLYLKLIRVHESGKAQKDKRWERLCQEYELTVDVTNSTYGYIHDQTYPQTRTRTQVPWLRAPLGTADQLCEELFL
eukprot:TRINITY_DN10912_c0_g1_i1.p1 TRINITY_DN10912_c0_g1~~TRINITY_DN10912_c0_g1_i1.p1  ORF type:complete len:421 (+),score=93.80 TRINITY_DN10912_c0_g1_i1:99-1361(+)